jgi:hypothetical protein
MTMKTTFLFLCYAMSSVAANAATVAINWSVTTDPIRVLLDKNSTPLSAGTGAAGDGTLVQLGYYTLATVSNPFTGSWVSLASSTMGDNGVEIAGKFSTTTILGATPFAAPSVGTPLAIRFFDGVSVATSSYFNAVANTSGAWNFIAPTDPAPVINIVIDKDTNIKFQAVGGAFSTQLAVPEPSSMLLVSVALSMTIMKRRRHIK